MTQTIDEHDDPAIGAFLASIADDIAKGRNIAPISDELAQSMREVLLETNVDLDEDIAGETCL